MGQNQRDFLDVTRVSRLLRHGQAPIPYLRLNRCSVIVARQPVPGLHPVPISGPPGSTMTSPTPLFLGIDVGTQSLRASLIDPLGRAVRVDVGQGPARL